MDIKKAIKEHGFTIEETAKRMGISRITLTQNISRNPTYKTMLAIANAIGCNVGDFFLDEIATNDFVCPHCGKPIHIRIE